VSRSNNHIQSNYCRTQKARDGTGFRFVSGRTRRIHEEFFDDRISATKSISIDVPIERVFAFFTDAANWPQRAIVNMKSVKRADNQWWNMESRDGDASHSARRGVWHASWFMTLTRLT
jgi:hypothetical protein